MKIKIRVSFVILSASIILFGACASQPATQMRNENNNSSNQAHHGHGDHLAQVNERGGRIRITTNNKEALAAVHEFLRFQIADHQTGDSTEIEKL